MIIRLATQKDAPALWSILMDYKEQMGDQLLKDEASLTIEDLEEAISNSEIVVMAETVNGVPDYPVGGVRFSEQNEDLHVRINLVMRPEYQRIAIKQNAFDAIIEFAFRYYKVKKVKALIAEPRTTAIRMVELTRFKSNGLFKNEEYLLNGQPVDVKAYEVHRGFWHYAKRLHNKYASLMEKVGSLDDISFLQALCHMLKLSMKKGYA